MLRRVSGPVFILLSTAIMVVSGCAQRLPERPGTGVLRTGVQAHRVEAGTRCWNGRCACGLVVTPSRAARVNPSELVRVELPYLDHLAGARYRWTEVSEHEPPEQSSDGRLMWPGLERTEYQVLDDPFDQLSIAAPDRPGRYVMEVWGYWNPWGDASYGFLIDVVDQDASPTLDHSTP